MLALGRRPRELSWWHAGPMLFGDWGTSRLYVLGLAFVATGAGSFFYVALMGALLLVVAWAYTVICRAYPEGGGVYAAARERSRVLGVVGGLLLFADYVVTAALSALVAFHYLDVSPDAQWAWAIGAIVVLGGVHLFGPKRAGVLALWIAAAAFVGYLVIAAFSLGSVETAVSRVEVPKETVGVHWTNFVHIVLALSGVEAVANMTGIMVEPIRRTARWTIWPVAIEVVGLNLLLALAMLAVPPTALAGRQEDMVQALSEHYVGPGFTRVASVVFGLLLLSASSTAITGMLGVLFAMARDAEIPRGLGRMNRFGVPVFGLVVATAAPILVLLFQHDLVGLGALYAIGVIGAIALNCFATATSTSHPLRRAERVGILAVSVVMLAIWVTVAVVKPQALLFAAIVLAAGLLARLALRTYRVRVRPVDKQPFPPDAPRILIASRGDTFVVDKGFDRAAEIGAAALVCLVREASFVLDGKVVDRPDPALDPEAVALFDYARKSAQDRAIPWRSLYTISTAPMSVIADHAVTLGVSEVHVGGSRRTKVEKVFRGSPLEELHTLLPGDDVKIVLHEAPA